MPAVVDDLDCGVVQNLLVEFGAFHWDDGVLFTPNDQSGSGHLLQVMRQAGVVHIGLPSKARGHLPVGMV